MFYLLYFRKWKCCQVSTNQISEKDSRQQDNKKRERERERERENRWFQIREGKQSLPHTHMHALLFSLLTRNNSFQLPLSSSSISSSAIHLVALHGAWSNFSLFYFDFHRKQIIAGSLMELGRASSPAVRTIPIDSPICNVYFLKKLNILEISELFCS
jgi:hypothetical protein